ncbi:GNAT family N-acetyltransferase [Roseateles oligotrophus]|uniref:GNAT family N-acetyltransferase n=1 Tax=Roseateles oligotrophus TaxID=1769250 RepID=A0ABT2YIR6_9BURK|nr:GNAT family protein [Roseateles oligotrophus]MCV2369950.1 GNAT family N-acetyltransferase [Roseateles oligotrophus]
MPAKPDPILIEVPETIETERLLLAAPRPGIGPAMAVAIAESLGALSPWMPWAQQAPSFEDSEAVARRLCADFIARRDLTYQIYDRAAEGRRLLGGTGLHRLDWEVRRFEIGYWIRSSAQGHGFVSEAVMALTRMAFEQLQARRVEIRMDDVNLRSRAVAERCGFELEGILRRDSLTPAGELRNTCVYARLGL